nr:PREDICTED: uncharacterized protein LOC109035353 [Bemisia tabaci]
MEETNELPRMSYEYKHFEMPVESVLQGVKELVLDSLYVCISAWQGSISKRSSNKLEEIREVLSKLLDEYVLESKKPLELAEPKIRSCFAIPDHVLLPKDEYQRHQYTEDEEAALDRKLKNLKLRYKQAIYMETLLKEEKKVWEEVDIVEFQASKLKKLQTGNPDSFQIIDSLAREVQSLNNSLCNQNTTSSNQIVDSQVLKELSSHELSASAS